MSTNIPRGSNGQACTDMALLISMGCFPGLSGINKFGTNPLVGTTFENMWEQGGIWTKLTSATTLAVSSSSTDDTSAGVGTRTLIVEGLGSNYLEISETVTMNGQTPVITSNTFLFVNRAYSKTAGTSHLNVGDLYIADDSVTHTTGIPDTASLVQAKVGANKGQTQQAIYTIPAGKTAYLTSIFLVSGASKIVDFEFHIINNNTGVHRISFEGEETNSDFSEVYNPYKAIPEMSTINVHAKVDVGTAKISAVFDIILVDNEEYNL